MRRLDEFDLAADCERYPHDDRRGPSTLCVGDTRAKVDQSQTELAAAMGRVALALLRCGQCGAPVSPGAGLCVKCGGLVR